MRSPVNALEPSGLLGTSLQRLYDSEGAAGNGSAEMGRDGLPQLPMAHSSETTLDLTQSLLESVFEISEFDPLPHFSFREDQFGFGSPADNPPFSASTKTSPAKKGDGASAPLPERLHSGRHGHESEGHAGTSPAGRSGTGGLSGGQSAMDRRKLPRRESECIVSICPCRTEERLTGERISWLLHSAKIKGRLIDVSMSGVAFHLTESLPAGSRILLRIANRTIDKQVDTQAEVLRSRAASDGGWDLVCRFNKNLTFEQIHTVGRSLFAATIV